MLIMNFNCLHDGGILPSIRILDNSDRDLTGEIKRGRCRGSRMRATGNNKSFVDHFSSATATA